MMRTVRSSDEAEALGAMFASAARASPAAAAAPLTPDAQASSPVSTHLRLIMTLAASILATLAVEPLVNQLTSAGPAWSLISASALLAGIALVAAWIARVRIEPLRASAGTLAFGAGQGIGGLCWCGVVLALAGRLLPGTGRASPALLIGAIVLLAQVAGEELFFRGWVQAALARVAPPWVAVALAATIFSGLHLVGGARSPLALIDILLAGIWLGLVARQMGLVAAVAAHWGWNAAEMLGLGVYPNPGVGPWGAIWDREISGPSVWGGGEEGLNASIVATFIFAGLALATAAMQRQDA